MKKFALAFVALSFMAASALAGSCPKQAKAITASLESSTMSMASKDKIKAMIKLGMEQHSSGQHSQSLATLAEAKTAIGS
ncbi:MAG: hypothetical protein ACTSY1_04630 [Alphaproteobacteria bacterium]